MTPSFDENRNSVIYGCIRFVKILLYCKFLVLKFRYCPLFILLVVAHFTVSHFVIRTHTLQVDTLSNQLTSEEHYDSLTTYTQPILDNLEHAESMLDDLTIRYDDAWGRMKALSSSLARESPSSAGVYAPGAEMFDIRTMQKQMSGEYEVLIIISCVCRGYWL